MPDEGRVIFRRRPGLDCCHMHQPFSPEIRRCFNPGSRRPEFFREECRDCFWPNFTHPRWLPCRVLFCCCIHCPRRRCDERD